MPTERVRELVVDRHYTPAQVADLCGGVAVRTVHRWIEDGRRSAGRRGLWPVRRASSRLVLVPASAVTRFLSRRPA